MEVNNLEINELLIKFLKFWPKGKNVDVANSKLIFESNVHPKFDTSDFYLTKIEEFRIFDKVFIYENIARVLIVDSGLPNTHNLLTLVKNKSNWQIRSFKFMCLTCFGATIINDEICNTCGGLGWGTLEDLKIYE